MYVCVYVCMCVCVCVCVYVCVVSTCSLTSCRVTFSVSFGCVEVVVFVLVGTYQTEFALRVDSQPGCSVYATTCVDYVCVVFVE